MKVEADKNKANGLSSRRLMFVEELERKLLSEKTNARKLERELLDTLSQERGKTTTALLEAGESEMKVVNLKKEVEELKAKRTSETEEYLENFDALKKRISSLEEENSLLESGAQQRSVAKSAPRPRSDDSGKVAELEEEVKRLTAKNRKLAVAAGDGGSSTGDITLKQAIEALEREKKNLAKQNTNQKKAIQALEGSVSKDDGAAIEQARKEDDLERATALLANLYFTKKNSAIIEKVASDIALPVNDENKGATQSELVESMMQKKQARWWKTLDGFMGTTGYVKSAQSKRSSNLAE
jgi:hypothetical protein